MKTFGRDDHLHHAAVVNASNASNMMLNHVGDQYFKKLQNGQSNPSSSASSAAGGGKIKSERRRSSNCNSASVGAVHMSTLNGHSNGRRSAQYPSYQRVLLYARQENEDVYTAFHVVPPSVQGLLKAVCAKYQIDSVDIRYAFRQTRKGLIVKIDDDMIR